MFCDLSWFCDLSCSVICRVLWFVVFCDLSWFVVFCDLSCSVICRDLSCSVICRDLSCSALQDHGAQTHRNKPSLSPSVVSMKCFTLRSEKWWETRTKCWLLFEWELNSGLWRHGRWRNLECNPRPLSSAGRLHRLCGIYRCRQSDAERRNQPETKVVLQTVWPGRQRKDRQGRAGDHLLGNEARSKTHKREQGLVKAVTVKI